VATQREGIWSSMQRGDGEMEGGGDEDGTKGEEWKEIRQCLYV
jgi:hypothetical protein